MKTKSQVIPAIPSVLFVAFMVTLVVSFFVPGLFKYLVIVPVGVAFILVTLIGVALIYDMFNDPGGM
jgi:hypothetical protein